MNILFVSTDYPERGRPTTGFPNYLYRVSLSLLQMGHKPIILAPGKWDGHRMEQGIDIWTVQVEFLKIKSPTLEYTVNALHKGYTLNKKVKELCRDGKIDIIQFTSLQGTALFYHGKIPAVLRLSSYAKIAYGTFQTYPAQTVKVMSYLERLSARRCKVVFAPCEKTGQAFGQDCGRKVKIIETPFINDVDEYDNGFFTEHLKGKKYVLFFGSLYAEKGIGMIAEILERFLEDNPDYFFVFIGSIYDIFFVQLLKRKAGKHIDRVRIWDALPHKQLYPVIMQADFVVLPSFMENLSNACIEAMYFGKVVIGTDGASFEQLIIHGKNGLLCRIGDAEDLLEKMRTVVSMDAKQKMKMGELAKVRTNRLKPEYAVKKLVCLYGYVINSNNG